MSDAVPVLEYLKGLVGSHQFTSGSSKENRHSNFHYEIGRSVLVKGADNKLVPIPTGSTLVVYRDPTKVVDAKMTVACFHHSGRNAQTVVMGGGKIRSTNLESKTLLDNKRRMPRLHLPHFD